MLEYVLTLLAAAAVTYLLTPLVRRFAMAVGAMHAARDRDVHVVPTPLLGGFAMYAGLIAGLLVASRLSTLNSAFAETNMAKGLLLAGGLIVVMGFVDDRWGMGALSKLAGQVAAGVILVWSGAEVTWLPAPGGGTLGLTSDQQTAVTILVVVMTINAVNFIDGLDGLAAGIVGIGAGAFFIYYYTLTHRLGLPEQTGPALASAVLAGMCLGFLPHNFHPARIFMGDTGAMLIGLLLAYAPISSLASLDPGSLTNPSAYASGTVNRFGAILPLLLPAAILLIPYADLLMAVVRRTRAGMSPFAADRQHLHHRLLAIGHSQRASVLIMYLWAALFSGSVVWLSIVRTPLFVLAIVTVAAMLVLLVVSIPRLRLLFRPASRAGTRYRRATRGVAAPAAGPGAAPGHLADGFLPTPPAYARTPSSPAPTTSTTAWPSAPQSAGPPRTSSVQPGMTPPAFGSPLDEPMRPAGPGATPEFPGSHTGPASSTRYRPEADEEPLTGPLPARGSGFPGRAGEAAADAGPRTGPLPARGSSWFPGRADEPATDAGIPSTRQAGAASTWFSGRADEPHADAESRTAPQDAAWPAGLTPKSSAGSETDESARPPAGSPWLSGLGDEPPLDGDPHTRPHPAATWFGLGSPGEHDPPLDGEPVTGPLPPAGTEQRPAWPPAGTGQRPAWPRNFGLSSSGREPPRARPFTSS